jgi:hypothetical protein
LCGGMFALVGEKHKPIAEEIHSALHLAVEAEETHSGLIREETPAVGFLHGDWHDLRTLLLQVRFHSLHPLEVVFFLYARWVRVPVAPLDYRLAVQTWVVFRLI